MDTKKLVQGIISNLSQENYLSTAIEAFLISKKVENLQPETIIFYQKKLKLFIFFCDEIAVNQVSQIDPNVIRNFFLWLREKNHNEGGISCYYRSLKTFIRWWITETEPDNYKNPFLKVKSPKVALEPLEPINTEDINKLLDSCHGKNFTDIRDFAIINLLLDTGCRASESLSINLNDIDLLNGCILIRSGKGRKPRNVFIGKKTRKAIRNYLKIRSNSLSALWITDDQNDRLSYWGLKGMMKRRSKIAGIKKTPQVHAFRRTFALSMLESGVDIVSISKMMGHADLQILTRYLKQSKGSLEAIHHLHSPVDNLIMVVHPLP